MRVNWVRLSLYYSTFVDDVNTPTHSRPSCVRIYALFLYSARNFGLESGAS